jgi:hypothetical protein
MDDFKLIKAPGEIKERDSGFLSISVIRAKKDGISPALKGFVIV